MPQIFPRWFDTVARAGIVGGVLLVPASALSAWRCSTIPTTSPGRGPPTSSRCRSATSTTSAGWASIAGTATQSAEPLRVRRHAADRDVHELPPANLGRGRTAGPGPRELEDRAADPLEAGAQPAGLRLLRPQRPSSKGVGCVECHGRLDRMPLTWQVQPLTMAWCLECHRDPGPPPPPRGGGLQHDMDGPVPARGPTGGDLAGRGELAERLREHFRIKDTRTLTSCSTCHR